MNIRNQVRVSNRKDHGITVGQYYRDPILTQHDDGSISMAWANDNQQYAVIHREVLDHLVTILSAVNKQTKTAERETTPDAILTVTPGEIVVTTGPTGDDDVARQVAETVNKAMKQATHARGTWCFCGHRRNVHNLEASTCNGITTDGRRDCICRTYVEKTDHNEDPGEATDE